MNAKTAAGKRPRMALLVHGNEAVVSSLQDALSERGFVTVVAQDLASALSAITTHYFEVAIVSSQLACRLRDFSNRTRCAGLAGRH